MPHQRTLSADIPEPRPEYPRPDWDRSSRSPESWLSLNGLWSFAFDDADEGLDHGWYKRHAGDTDWPHENIIVPFAFQTEASGHVHTRDRHEILWYARDVPWDINLDSADGSELLLQFGNVDYESTVWINGRQVGTHRGVHSSFDIDITRAVKDTTKFGDNFTVTVRVVDRIPDRTQPRGKQVSGGEKDRKVAAESYAEHALNTPFYRPPLVLGSAAHGHLLHAIVGDHRSRVAGARRPHSHRQCADHPGH